MTQIGVFAGNSPSGISGYESWLGRQADFALGFVDHASWDAFDSSVPWGVNLWRSADHEVHWSVPLIVDGASLSAGATGAYNDHYRKAAEALSTSPGDGKITVRVGWEFNGDWFPWKAQGNEGAYIGAFRQLVDTFRSVSDRFQFEWTPSVGRNQDGQMDPSKAYPGDEYVDVVGMDFYYNTAWDSKDPATAWDSMVERQYGLRWHQDFANAHGKATAYPEWGVNATNAAAYVEKAAAWFESHDVAYQAYWDSNLDFSGKLSGDEKAGTSTAYKAAFAEAGTFRISGTAGNDVLNGTAKDDMIAGGAGADTMGGGAGDDTYVVDHAGDRVLEAAGAGRDTVRSLIDSYVLSDNAEDLTLVGGNAQTGVGNALANHIVGGVGNDTIDGLGGDDVLMGGAGRDTFVFRPGSGHDTILDFEGGVGAGDVVRLVDSGFTSVAQVKAAMASYGQDAVLALPNGGVITFEGERVDGFADDDFVLVGTVAARPAWNPQEPAVAPTPVQKWISGTAAAETLNGTAGNDSIDGKEGNDRMVGGKGHDSYTVDRATDVIVENADEGIDTVVSWSTSYRLPDNVEHLKLVATYAQTGIGNGLANRITGTSGASTIDGAGGDDWLTGGGGADTFVFRPGSGHDVITDFEAGAAKGDVVRLEATGLTSFAAVQAAMSDHAEGAVLTSASGDTILFKGVAASAFAANDFLFA